MNETPVAAADAVSKNSVAETRSNRERAADGKDALRAGPAANTPAAPPPPTPSIKGNSFASAELAQATRVESTPINPPAQVATDAGAAMKQRRQKSAEIAALREEQAKQQALMYDARYNERSVLWRINAGRLQKLDASRNAYDDVAVTGTSRLSIVGSLGTEVWVGGSDGVLYYSNDQGAHWIPVRTGAWSKDATFVGLTPTAIRSVEVHLSNGERWRSADGGASWSKYE